MCHFNFKKAKNIWSVDIETEVGLNAEPVKHLKHLGHPN